MGFVFAVIRIMPKDTDVFEALKKSLNFAESMEEKPIAFGLKAVEIIVKVPDGAGGLDGVEKKLGENKLVSSYEILEVGRL
jgi:elongation factor 1-beta